MRPLVKANGKAWKELVKIAHPQIDYRPLFGQERTCLASASISTMCHADIGTYEGRPPKRAPSGYDSPA